MEVAKEVRRVLSEAESRLVHLLRDAVDREAFSDVATIASMLAHLRDAIYAGQAGAASSAGDRELGKAEDGPPEVVSEPKRRQKRTSRRYPRFRREQDRLVKLGWSKREGREYVHKATRDAVDAVVDALRRKDGKEFSMDEILPLLARDKAEVPSYQAYLVMAWLRSWGAVKSVGRGGYRTDRAQIDSDKVEQEWASLKPHEERAV